MSNKPKSNGWPDDRTLKHFVYDTVSLLQVPVKNIHSRRALLYKVADDIAARQRLKTDSKRLTPSHKQFWTENAWYQFVVNNQKKSYEGLHLEHVIPKGVVTTWLCDENHDTRKPVERKKIVRAIRLFMLTCWVTDRANSESSEQLVLDNTVTGFGTKKFKDNMPEDWNPTSGELWARYQLVQERSKGRLSNWKMRLDHEKCSEHSSSGSLVLSAA